MSENPNPTIGVQARKAAKPESDQLIINNENEASGSGSCSLGQLIEESDKIGIIIHGKTTINKSLQEKLNSLKLNQESEKQIKSRIQKVHFLLRDSEKFGKYYEPRLVASGPIHHRNRKFEYSEPIKRKLAGSFIDENHINAESLYENIMFHLDDLKNCYDHNVIKEYDNEELAWMFLVDGCSLLHFIHCDVWDNDPARIIKNKCKPQSKLEKLQIKKDQIAFARQDVFLLENQLPYQLLELIINMLIADSDKTAVKNSITTFIQNNMMLIPQQKEQSQTEQQSEQSEGKEPCHLLELLREQLLVCKPEGKSQILHTPHSFRNVKELRAAGIRLKPTGKNCLDISFDNCCFMGTLRLPSLVVDDSTAPKLLNLIALEMCPDFMNTFDVTSYICFLDSLIDYPADVEELRKAKTIVNMLGSDDDVAELFNNIATDLVPNPDLYADVKDKIENRYESKWITWITQALHDHFSSPWTILAFIGVLFGLFFSAVQAYFSAFSKSK